MDEQTREAARQVVETIPLIMRTVGAEMRRAVHTGMPAHMRVLGMCSRRAWSLSQLAEAQAVSAPTMSKTVNTLVERGWLARTPSEEDRRVVHVTVTPAGKQMLDEAHQQTVDHVAALLAALSPDERETLLAGLAVLRSALTPVLESEASQESLSERS